MNNSQLQREELGITTEDIKNGYIGRHMPNYATDKEPTVTSLSTKDTESGNTQEENQSMNSLILDTNERFASTLRRLNENLESYENQPTSIHDTELIIQKMEELISFVDRIMNRHQFPGKQR